MVVRTDGRGAGHWVGVRAGWREEGASPLDRLFSLPPHKLRTHLLAIGATGSGKTNLLHHLIAQDALNGHSFVVLDLRGDLMAAALEILAGRADPAKVRVLDLRGGARPTGFDPLFGAGEPYFRALGVLEAVRLESDSWGVQIDETLRNALMLLAEAGRPLTRLDDLFHDRAFLLECLRPLAPGPLASFWRRYDEMAAERKAALASPALNKVSALFATEALRRILGHPTPMDLGAHLDTPGSVLLVSLAADELHAAGRMVGRLALAAACREVFARVGVPESRRNPVRLYVDEFEHFGSQEFETVLAEGRRFGLSLVLAHQTLAQLAPRMRSLVLGNVGVKAAFRCGREDAATLSRDMAGDPRALDLASLPVGGCVVWARGEGCVPVEVNAPIVRDVGAPSARARRFLREVQDRAAPQGAETPKKAVVRERWEGGGPGTDAPKVGKNGKDVTPAALPAMEDWLS